ncbi:hypothetical protein WN55_06307 [Dufourea novaeangliae]|uniref:Uncharacterized protein n=1 Tax=Dufourea novaeangliae TaxID=178035 RepID=A0A154PPX5_DUFNO|nr:hypothetical protein WN55_06307 [Dufourea novaeangliae]
MPLPRSWRQEEGPIGDDKPPSCPAQERVNEREKNGDRHASRPAFTRVSAVNTYVYICTYISYTYIYTETYTPCGVWIATV